MQFQLTLLSNITILISIDHCLNVKTTISLLQPSIPETALNSGKVTKPLKMVNFDAQKSEFEPRKKSLSPNPYENPLFAKNGVQIGQILPLWAYLYFTPGYRGLPPCTLSQHPDNRETGYSNVLPPPLLTWPNRKRRQ